MCINSATRGDLSRKRESSALPQDELVMRLKLEIQGHIFQ